MRKNWRDELFRRLTSFGATAALRRAAVEALEAERMKGFSEARAQAARLAGGYGEGGPTIIANAIRAMEPEKKPATPEQFVEPKFCAMCGCEDFNHSTQYGGCIVTTNAPERGDRCQCLGFCPEQP